MTDWGVTILVAIMVVLALIPAVNTLINAILLRVPALPMEPPSVAILIPARDEQATIRACIDAALASVGATIEVIVLDDGSTDATAAIVKQLAAADPRVRLASAPPLPAGWKGKPHACHVLSTLTQMPHLLFVDADVRLAPEAAARLAPRIGENLVSGVPRQLVSGFLETAIVPMINSMILGYLPLAISHRQQADPSLAAACGQLLMVRAEAYRACGGHGAIAGRMHDALSLARNFRRAGFGSVLVDATPLATCRMYETPAAVWSGFGKNAVEGMARPLALPIWTLLLFGGQVMPFIALLFLLAGFAFGLWQTGGILLACASITLARVVQAVKCRERWTAVPIHPIGVVLTLCIQWQALYGYFTGRKASWRGRSYAVDL